MTALSQVMLIFCTQCSPGPRVHLSLCFPKGSSLWLSHRLQTWGLCWIAARITKKRHFAACYAVSAWKYLEGMSHMQGRPRSRGPVPPTAGGGGMEKVHISATCLSLTPNMTNQYDSEGELKRCWGSWSCEKARPSGLNSAWERGAFPFPGSPGGQPGPTWSQGHSPVHLVPAWHY